MEKYLGVDCGSVSLNLVLLTSGASPVSLYRRTMGRPLAAFVKAAEELIDLHGEDIVLRGAMVTGSGRSLLSDVLNIPAINEISAHAAGVYRVNPAVRSVVEIGGQDSKFMQIEPPRSGGIPRISLFRMNEICAAGTGAFLDEQAERLEIGVESFGPMALTSRNPAAIAGRCAVFAKTDMIHKAQEGAPIPDVLLGLAFALARNYVATLVRGEPMKPLVSLQGGVMHNQAVVFAFRELLGLAPHELVIPPHFDSLGAFGCALLAGIERTREDPSLSLMKDLAVRGLARPKQRTFLAPLDASFNRAPPFPEVLADPSVAEPPFVMGLDIGSVSVKGVVIDGKGRLLSEDYRLSRSLVLDAAERVLASLAAGVRPDVIAVTGSGRHLVGKLLAADLIVNEITAQATAGLRYAPDADTIVEIGGQDSKWIALEDGSLKDFEMNRVCAAGTGSFLMAQAQRLGLSTWRQFDDAAFSSDSPVDLGNRCAVFMESDLVHHQNNGAKVDDLAAGACVSIVRNYLERVANHRPLGKKVLFLGGVAGTPAVRAAFEQETGRSFDTPDFYRVSGALGAALNALARVGLGEITPVKRERISLSADRIRREQFSCKRCPNECLICKYHSGGQVVFHGGLCDRWEREEASPGVQGNTDLFQLRSSLLEELCGHPAEEPATAWGIVRSPQFFEWFPFWKGFCEVLGIRLLAAPRAGRKQFEKGSKFLRVETCLPVKVMAGQISDLVDAGVRTLFHPVILNEPGTDAHAALREYCPYIQASSQFFRDAFDVDWKEPVISFAFDPDPLQRELQHFAAGLGIPRVKAKAAVARGLEQLRGYKSRLRVAGAAFLNSLTWKEQALVVLGKPYHTSDVFQNMNLGSMFSRLGIRALPADLYPLSPQVQAGSVTWKYQGNMIRVARELSRDDRLFPVLITFFGCGPDPFTVRHIRAALGEKPLLVLEMDEHSSRAGLMTRIEAFLERINRERVKPDAAKSYQVRVEKTSPQKDKRRKPHRAEVMYMPFISEHTYGFAAAAQSVGIDARVLPQPDHESEKLGRPHLVGGECHPYVLILGDYLKLSGSLSPLDASRSLFYMLGPNACRLGQFPFYLEDVRREKGLSVRVIRDIGQGLQAFGLPSGKSQQLLLRTWEGLNAYDVLVRVYHQVRPISADEAVLDGVFATSRDRLCKAIAAGRVRLGIEEALHDLYRIPTKPAQPRPLVAITGDYYTRVVPFANNDVYREIESLGGTVLPPPTFSDCLKMGTMRDMIWSLLSRRSRGAARNGVLYLLLAASEFKVKGSHLVRRSLAEPTDIMGRQMWKRASRGLHMLLPSGITAPFATALKHVDQGADGLLNLMTLNCSYGTVVTAALGRVLRDRPSVPMLTLIYDGLQKTNERTRLEAFMEQVHDHFRSCGVS